MSLDTLLLVIRGSSDAGVAVTTGDVLDLSIACRRLRDWVKEAASRMGWRLEIVDSLEDALRVASEHRPSVVVLLDGLSVYPDLVEALCSSYEEFSSIPEDILVLVTRPYVDRGLRLRVKGETVTEVGEGGDVFAGIVVATLQRFESIARKAKSIEEFIERLVSAPARYWRDVWLRLEKPHDPILYNMLVVSRLRNQVISERASVSPTAVIEGPVIVEEGVRIDHYAVVKGPAVLCRGSFVGLHATIRGYSSIEPGARVGAYSETYVALLEPRATLSSHTYITGSVVGEEARVEPFVVSKVVYGAEAARKLGVLAPFTPEIRVGAVIAARTRINAGSVLEPLSVVRG